MKIITATLKHLDILLPLVRGYHEFDNIHSTEESLKRILTPLLTSQDYGKIWLLEDNRQMIGYLAVCFGYSIEFGGRDAIIDEIFIIDSERGKGYGRTILEHAKQELINMGIVAASLEVSTNNIKAQEYYSKLGFIMRKHFHLMSCRFSSINDLTKSQNHKK